MGRALGEGGVYASTSLSVNGGWEAWHPTVVAMPDIPPLRSA